MGRRNEHAHVRDVGVYGGRADDVLVELFGRNGSERKQRVFDEDLRSDDLGRGRSGSVLDAVLQKERRSDRVIRRDRK